MKTLVSLLAVTSILLGLTGCSQEPNPFVGSWELVSSKSIYSDTTISADMSALQSIKILSQTHFAYVTTMKAQDSIIFVRAGSGTYSFNEKEYVEKIEYSSVPEMLGKAYDFTHEIKGDTWSHIGDLENFNVKIEEVWRRTK